MIYGLMAIITKWWCAGFFALAKPNLFSFIKHYFNASVWSAFNSFMIAIAKRAFLCKPATAP